MIISFSLFENVPPICVFGFLFLPDILHSVRRLSFTIYWGNNNLEYYNQSGLTDYKTSK